MRYSLSNRSLAPLVGLGILAIGSSVLLMPRGREMALLRIQTGDRAVGLAMLEERVINGDHSPATIAALATARAEGGNIAGAAQLLEDMIERDGPNSAALRMLEGFERTAKQTAPLIHTLEQLQQLSPSIERQREIARLYAELGQSEDRLRAVRDLVRLFPAEPVEYVMLAQLERTAGHVGEAEAVLQALAARHPKAVDASIVGLEIGILLSEGQADDAFTRARDWLANRDDLGMAAPLVAGALSVGGRADLAVTLLEPIAARTAKPEIVTALAQAESDSGRPQAALVRLEQLNADGSTEAGRATALLRLRLALAVGEVDRVVLAIDRIGLANVSRDLLLTLAELAVNGHRVDVLRTMLVTAGQRFLDDDPVVGARVFLALGDKEVAQRWSSLAIGTITGRPDRAIQLAEVELDLGRVDAAIDLLGRALSERTLQPAWLRGAASLYVRAHYADQGRLALDQVRRTQPGQAADVAWAIAAAAAGHSQEVLAWLSGPGRQAAPADVLQDLFYLASDARAFDLALEAARRLAVVRRAPSNTLLLARALLNAGQPKQALDQLRSISDPAVVPEDLRAAVLLAAWRQKAPVGPELRAIWVGRLAAAKTRPERDAAISLLLELHAHSELLPTLRGLVEQDPQHWLWSFGEAAKATGRKAELVAVWARISNQPGTPALLRRQLAFSLLENGNKAAAEQAFRTLADAAPPASPDVRELLFIWGPRPNNGQLDWIEARAQQAGTADKAAWMHILVDAGASARAVAVYRASAEPSPAMNEIYMAALSAIGSRSALAAAIRNELARASSATQLQRLAQLSERAGDAPLEQHVLQKLVAAGGMSPSVHRRLGVLAYQRRDMAVAERELLAWTAATGGDYETRMLLGDLATRQRDGGSARQHYAASLALVQTSGETSARAGVVKANLLHRLGHDAEASQLYETLLATHPHDTNLRADYVAMLMEQGSLSRARTVLTNR